LRVVLISFDFAEVAAPLASALSARCDVHLYMPRDQIALFDGELAPSVAFRPFDKPRLRRPLRQLRLMRRLLRETRALRPDVVHVQQGHLWLNLVIRRFRPFSALVVTVHDPLLHPGDRLSAKTPQWVNNLAFRAADSLIVHASALVRELARIDGVDPARIYVVPLRVDPGAMVDGAADLEEPATILFFGRIWPYKGLEYLVRAAPLIAADVPQLRIIIAGEGEPFGRYAELMEDPRLFEVRYGFIDNDERSRLFARAAVVVLPYIQASQSGVVPVAYAAGKPVVATTVGGLPESVEEGVTGLLVPPADVPALAAAVSALLTDETRRRQMGAAAARRFERELAPDAVAEQTIDVYRAAIDSRSG
jgi:glycosyltransferase involved in cell wall biosynthesis